MYRKKLETKLYKAFDEFRISGGERNKINNIMNQLWEYHPSTAAHSIRVALDAKAISEFMNINPKPALYSILHDTGKLTIPLKVLFKTKDFNENDWKIMKPHTINGFKMLLDKGYYLATWLALTHHKYKIDSYPIILPGLPESISNKTKKLFNLYSRITSLADQNDALKRQNDEVEPNDIPIEELRKQMIKLNPNLSYLINNLYNTRILL